MDSKKPKKITIADEPDPEKIKDNPSTNEDVQAEDAKSTKKIAVSFNDEAQEADDVVRATVQESSSEEVDEVKELTDAEKAHTFADDEAAEESDEAEQTVSLEEGDTKEDDVESDPEEAEHLDEEDDSENEELPTSEDDDEEEKETNEKSSEDEIDSRKTLEELTSEAEKAEETGDIFPPDPEIDAAVDDIVRTESDTVIASADAKIAERSERATKRTFRQKVAGFFKAWWHKKLLRYGTLVLFFGVIAFTILFPTTRYGVLNTFGVRVSSSLTVIDSQTRLPLKNIQVDLQDKSARTDEQGMVSFSELKQGKSTLRISKIGYADNEQAVILGWGSNPLGQKELLATGEQFIFFAQDWLNGKTLSDVSAESGESSAKADADGKVTLTVGEEGLADAEVTIRANGYREERLKLSSLSKETVVSMVPDRRHAFVSNRNGQYDLYVIDVDGKNEKILLEATGKERETPVILPHPDENIIAFVSSRSGEQNRDGFLVDELFLVDTQTGEQNRVARSEQLQLIGWHEDTLVFWQVIEGTSVSNPERSKLIGYNKQTRTRVDLAAANYFNDVRMVNGTVYYAVSSYAVPQSQAKLFTVAVDGANKITLVDQLIFGIYRTSYHTLLFAGDNQKWFQEVGGGQVTEVGSQAQPLHKKFNDSPNGERTVWVEVRDGRGVLLMSSIDTFGEEERVLTLAGLESVVYWLNDSTVVFRIITNGETADYVVDVDKKEERKIVDVTASSRLYY